MENGKVCFKSRYIYIYILESLHFDCIFWAKKGIGKGRISPSYSSEPGLIRRSRRALVGCRLLVTPRKLASVCFQLGNVLAHRAGDEPVYRAGGSVDCMLAGTYVAESPTFIKHLNVVEEVTKVFVLGHNKPFADWLAVARKDVHEFNGDALPG